MKTLQGDYFKYHHKKKIYLRVVIEFDLMYDENAAQNLIRLINI